MAHADRNMILFERIKAVISMMARGGASQSKALKDEDEEEAGGLKENKIVMTELMGQLLKYVKETFNMTFRNGKDS